MHPCLHARLGVQQRQDGQQRVVRVVDDDAHRRAARRVGELGLAEHRRGARALKVREVPAAGNERQVAGAGTIERGDAGDGDVPGAHEAAARQGGDFARRQGVRHHPPRAITGPAGAAPAPAP
jgi:hypothetical protein